MKEKGFIGRLMSKAGTGILFVAACFASVFILVEFHSNYVLVGVVALLLLISAYLFLNSLFEEKSKEWIKSEDEEESRRLHGDEESEEGLRKIKYLKEMVSELKKQNELLENMENEIYTLSEKQITQTKAVIKYNKENARQIAVSERETIMLAKQELMQALTNGVNVPETAVAEEIPDLPDLPEMDDIAFMEEEIPEIPDLPEVSEMDDISIMEEEPELPPIEDIVLDDFVLEEPVTEEIPEEEPVTETVAEEESVPEAPTLSSDPNTMMTPDDIAKLIASMGQ